MLQDLRDFSATQKISLERKTNVSFLETEEAGCLIGASQDKNGLNYKEVRMECLHFYTLHGSSDGSGSVGKSGV